MYRHDHELLNKQLKRFQPLPRQDGMMALTIVGVFLAGMTAGGLLFGYGSRQPLLTTSNDGTNTLAFFLKGTPTVAR